MTSPSDRWRHPRIYRLPEAAPEVWQELERSYRLIGELDEALRSHWKLDVSTDCGSQLSPVLSPFRCLVLACVGRQAVWGIRPTRLARMLRVPGSLLNYHLGRLQKAGLIQRSADTLSDGRRVMVQLTWAGGEALAASARVLASTSRAIAESMTVVGAAKTRPGIDDLAETAADAELGQELAASS